MNKIVKILFSVLLLIIVVVVVVLINIDNNIYIHINIDIESISYIYYDLRIFYQILHTIVNLLKQNMKQKLYFKSVSLNQKQRKS